MWKMTPATLARMIEAKTTHTGVGILITSVLSTALAAAIASVSSGFACDAEETNACDAAGLGSSAGVCGRVAGSFVKAVICLFQFLLETS